MNVLLLFGSPHPLDGDGATARLTGAFLDGLREDAAETPSVNVFDAYAGNVSPCTDCGACLRENICIHNDMDGLDDMLHAADAIVIASPVYHSSFPAPLKAVFDRTQRYFLAFRRGEHVFEKTDRPVFLLLTAGQKKEDGAVIKAQLRWILPTVGSVLRGSFVANGLNAGGISDEMLTHAHDSGKEFRSTVQTD